MIGNSLKSGIKRLKITQKEFADKVGIPYRTLVNYLNDSNEPDLETISKMAIVIGVNPGELLGPMGPDDFGINPDARDTVQIPILLASVSAGPGAINDNAEIKNFLTVERRAVKEELGVDPSRLTIVQVKGDSMEPDLRNGDYIFVDKDDFADIKEGFYAVHYDGSDFVKRLQRLPDGSLNIISSNRVYPPIHLDMKKHPGDFKVIGRVLGFINLKRV